MPREEKDANMTFEEFFECGRLRSLMTSYKQKKQKAIKICIDELQKHKAPYVALSGGKDSVAMAFIVDEAAKAIGSNFTLWTHLSDASFPGTEDVCRKVAKMTNRQLDISRCEKSAFDLLTIERKQAFGKTGVFFSEVRAYAKSKDLAFVGTRANESKRRMQAAKAHGTSFYSKSMGDCTVVNPLQWFDIYDVAAALVEYEAPIHPIYKKMSVDVGNNANGEPYFIRLSYITSKDLWEKGTLTFIKINYPEIYAKLLRACPDIARFA